MAGKGDLKTWSVQNIEKRHFYYGLYGEYIYLHVQVHIKYNIVQVNKEIAVM